MGRKIWVGVVCAAAAVMGISSYSNASEIEFRQKSVSAPSQRFVSTVVHRGSVTRIVDGDTVRFLPTEDGLVPGELKIRMVNIDAPETHFPTDAGPVVGQQPWGNTATDALKSLITDPTHAELEDFGLDKYGRTLGRLYIKGRDVNLEMVRMGMAFPYPICADADCTPDFFQRHNIAAYTYACEEAKGQGRGVFNPRFPLNEPPYFFRLRMNKKPASKFVGDIKTRRLYSPEQTELVPICSRVFFLTEREANRVGYFRTAKAR